MKRSQVQEFRCVRVNAKTLYIKPFITQLIKTIEHLNK